MLPVSQWIMAAVLAIAIAALAFRLRALNPAGAVAAFALGTVVVGTGGWWTGAILVAFFVSSSLLSRFSRSGEPQARGSRRDWVQVLANGGLLLVGCILFAVTGWQPWLAFGIGSITAATADTWSSEIGRTSPTAPRHVITWKHVPAGTSGAVSNRGLLASFGGALLIALLAGLAIDWHSRDAAMLIGFVIAGFGGGIVDSLLGATIQEQRWCDSCNKATEANPHSCGTSTRHIGGLEGFNNDVVNLVCGFSGALVGLLWSIL